MRIDKVASSAEYWVYNIGASFGAKFWFSKLEKV